MPGRVRSVAKLDYPERSGDVSERTCGEEELIGGAIVGCSAAKVDSPELVDKNRPADSIADGTHKVAVHRVERVNRAEIRVVGNEQGIAERAKIARCQGKAPRAG